MIRHLSFFCLICLVFLPCSIAAQDKFTVVIDAGHGGGDVGTPHRKGKQDEKAIALDVALKLGKLIEEHHKDVKVVYTRKTDIYPTLPDRTQIARKAKGDLFISIHINAAENTSARGFETYVFGITGLAGKSASEQARIKQRTMLERENLDINGKQIDFEKAVDIQTKILCQAQREKHNKYSMEFANLVQNSLIGALKRSSYRGNVNDRGVKEKNIFVLCYSPMPAILVELGYMSNVTEERFLNTLEAHNLFAASLYDAFAAYKQNWEKRQLDYDGNDIPAPTVDASTETAAAPRPSSGDTELKDVKLQRNKEEEAKVAQEKAAAEAKAKAEAEAKAAQEKAAAEAKAKAEAEAKAAQEKAAAEAKAKAEAEAKAAQEKAAAEAKAKAEAEAKAAQEKAAAEAKAKAEAEAKAAQEKAAAEAKAKAEAEAKAKAEAKLQAVANPSAIYHRIQFLVSKTKLSQGDPALKGLWPVEYYEDGGLYKYTIGNAANRSELQGKYQEVKKLFPDAFWVKFDAQGKRVK